MKLSIAAITAREEPGLEWLIEGLASQMTGDDKVEIIVVDFYGRSPRDLFPDASANASLLNVSAVAVAPKPTPWQGPYRVTSRDYAAIANARNTALCLASYDYVAFLDDRARLGPGWLAAVRRAEKSRASVVVGPCDRGSPRGPTSQDGRRMAYRGGRFGIPPVHMYGGNACMPLAWALEVGGFEEETDPVGGQDLVMGAMLVNCFHRIDFDATMCVVQDRRVDGLASDPDMHPFPRGNKGEPPRDKRGALQARYGTRTRTSHAAELAATRDRLRKLAIDGFPMHGATADTLDWFDGRPIGEM